MYLQKGAVLVCSIFAFVIGLCVACNNHELIIHHMKPCQENNLITYKDLKVHLGDDCILTPTGCATSSKDFSQLKVHYFVEKPPLPPFEGDIDACEELKTAEKELIEKLQFFSVPTSCPIKAQTICGDVKKTVDLNPYKNKFSLIRGAPIQIKVNATHSNEKGETVGTTCLEASFEIKKVKKAGDDDKKKKD